MILNNSKTEKIGSNLLLAGSVEHLFSVLMSQLFSQMKVIHNHQSFFAFSNSRFLLDSAILRGFAVRCISQLTRSLQIFTLISPCPNNINKGMFGQHVCVSTEFPQCDECLGGGLCQSCHGYLLVLVDSCLAAYPLPACST